MFTEKYLIKEGFNHIAIIYVTRDHPLLEHMLSGSIIPYNLNLFQENKYLLNTIEIINDIFERDSTIVEIVSKLLEKSCISLQAYSIEQVAIN